MKTRIFCLFLLLVPVFLLADWVGPTVSTGPKPYDQITLQDILQYENNLSTAPITYRQGKYTSLWDQQGHFDDVLKPGAILFFKTSEGRYGKMMIVEYTDVQGWVRIHGYEYYDVFFFVYTLFNSNGKVHSTQSTSPVSNLENQVLDFPLLPKNVAFMFLYYDFDHNQTSVTSFSNADVYNTKNEVKDRLFPKNGAEMFVVYRP
ncbi:MAG TPA: hypothetical protein P5560_05250 [Thermotogota bacterium]|nr:hypothetical protein [Thermotogota bacterium]HRW92344.1 hypothetical protein [Thermotogota bacterium]